MRIRILMAALVVGLSVPNSVLAADPPGHANTLPQQQVASADVDNLVRTRNELAAGLQAADAALAQHKTAAIETRKTELTSPNALSIRSPHAYGLLGELTDRDRILIDFSDEDGTVIADNVRAEFQPKFLAEVGQLGLDTTSCMTNGWPVVSTSFTIVGGKATDIELEELAPASPQNIQMANCVMQQIAGKSWTNLGRDVRTIVYWRKVGGP